jgi:hypothetical protein
MKQTSRFAAIALTAWLTLPAFAQQQPASPTTPETPAQQTAPNPADIDAQVAKMQELLTEMNRQMTQLQQAQDPQQRQQLLQQHWATMQNAMAMMPGMGHMMGSMMGPMMMWGDYRSLTPEQLAQRQYMLERWMPMQQMMMSHMMQHQGWMMQPPLAPPVQ